MFFLLHSKLKKKISKDNGEIAVFGFVLLFLHALLNYTPKIGAKSKLNFFPTKKQELHLRKNKKKCMAY